MKIKTLVDIDLRNSPSSILVTHSDNPITFSLTIDPVLIIIQNEQFWEIIEITQHPRCLFFSSRILSRYVINLNCDRRQS